MAVPLPYSWSCVLVVCGWCAVAGWGVTWAWQWTTATARVQQPGICGDGLQAAPRGAARVLPGTCP